MIPNRNLTKKGSALGLMLLVVLILLVMGTGLLSLGLHSRTMASRTAMEITARCAADAGLTEAFVEMNNKLDIKPWSDSNLPLAANKTLPNCDATYSYRVTGDYSSGYAIEATGYSGGLSKTVACRLDSRGPFEYALFGSKYISLKSGTSITGYNFSSPGEKLKIGVNNTEPGAIYARLGVLIDGDVFVGPGGDPNIVIDTRKECTITGDCYALNEAHELPPITAPDHLLALTSIGAIETTLTLTSDTKCDYVSLDSGEVLTIDGPVSLYIMGALRLDTYSQIQIVDANTNPDAYLNIYLGDYFTMQNGGAINNATKDTKKLKIYGLPTALQFSFLTDSVIYGAVYAPSANVTMFNKVEIYGSIMVDRMAQQVSANVHYDARLLRSNPADEMVRFVINKWYE